MRGVCVTRMLQRRRQSQEKWVKCLGYRWELYLQWHACLLSKGFCISQHWYHFLFRQSRKRTYSFNLARRFSFRRKKEKEEKSDTPSADDSSPVLSYEAVELRAQQSRMGIGKYGWKTMSLLMLDCFRSVWNSLRFVRNCALLRSSSFVLFFFFSFILVYLFSFFLFPRFLYLSLSLFLSLFSLSLSLSLFFCLSFSLSFSLFFCLSFSAPFSLLLFYSLSDQGSSRDGIGSQQGPCHWSVGSRFSGSLWIMCSSHHPPPTRTWSWGWVLEIINGYPSSNHQAQLHSPPSAPPHPNLFPCLKRWGLLLCIERKDGGRPSCRLVCWSWPV